MLLANKMTRNINFEHQNRQFSKGLKKLWGKWHFWKIAFYPVQMFNVVCLNVIFHTKYVWGREINMMCNLNTTVSS